jgi:hypothetical protein
MEEAINTKTFQNTIEQENSRQFSVTIIPDHPYSHALSLDADLTYAPPHLSDDVWTFLVPT